VTRIGAPRGATHGILTAIVAAGCLVAAGCSVAREQVAVGATAASTAAPYAGPGTVHVLMSGTQLHLTGVGIGVGNIWEEQYQEVDGTSTRGLTAGLFIAVSDDASQNRTLRVHPGMQVAAAGYRLDIVSIGQSSVQFAVIEPPE
jgi:hypothetical protein